MFNNIIGQWFYFPNLSTTTPNVSEVLTAITKLTSSMASTLYVAILQILMLVLLFFAIRGSLLMILVIVLKRWLFSTYCDYPDVFHLVKSLSHELRRLQPLRLLQIFWLKTC